jgi:integrase
VIFREAARLELIYRNPAEFIEVEAPASEPKGRTLELWEIQKLLEACETHPMGLLFRLLLGCGLRKGEALALTWGDVDLKAGELRVSKNGMAWRFERQKPNVHTWLSLFQTDCWPDSKPDTRSFCTTIPQMC